MVPAAYLDGRIEDDKGYGASQWEPLSEDCIKWLETKPPKSVVYVSFGSMVSLTLEQIEEIAWGLKESGLHFLWVVKESGRKHHFDPYILGLQLIWSLHFCSSQFSPYYFQIALNLVSTINLLTENAYMANGVHYWHT